MPTVLRGKAREGDFILSEDENGLSRDNLTIATGANLVIATGTVCGIVTASGNVKKLDTAASDGSDDAAVISIYTYDASAADVMGAFVSRNAQIKEDGLIWPAGISAADKKAAIAQLAARNIIIRPRSYVG